MSRCRKIGIQPSNWDIPYHNVEKYFFSHVCAKPLPWSSFSEPRKNVSENATVLWNRFPTIKLGHSPPQRQEIYFRMRSQKSLPWSSVLEPPKNKRKRVGVVKSVPNHLIVAFPTTMLRNIFFRMCSKNRSHGAAFWKHSRTQAKMRRCHKMVIQASMISTNNARFLQS